MTYRAGVGWSNLGQKLHARAGFKPCPVPPIDSLSRESELRPRCACAAIIWPGYQPRRMPLARPPVSRLFEADPDAPQTRRAAGPELQRLLVLCSGLGPALLHFQMAGPGLVPLPGIVLHPSESTGSSRAGKSELSLPEGLPEVLLTVAKFRRGVPFLRPGADAAAPSSCFRELVVGRAKSNRS